MGMILNIALFIPFGGFLKIYFKYFCNVKRTALAGFLMSLSIELLQLLTFRATDVDDLIMNTIGTLAGYGIAKLIRKKSKSVDEEDRNRMKLIGLILLVGLVIVFIRYPLTAFLFRILGL